MTTPTKPKSVRRRIGSITERRGKRGVTCRIKFDLEPNASGERRTVYKTIKSDRKAAEKELRKLIAQAERGVTFDAPKASLSDWIKAWLDEHIVGDVSARTHERYAELLNLHVTPRIGKLPLRQVGPSDIQSLYHELLKSGRRLKPRKRERKDRPAAPTVSPGLSKRTVVHCHRVLNRCLADAARLRHIDENPCRHVKPPRIKRQDQKNDGKTKMLILSRPDLGKLLAGVEDGTAPKSKNLPSLLPLLALDSGARRGEILAWSWAHFSHNSRSLRVDRSVEDTKAGGIVIKPVPKTEASRRTIFISARTADALAAEQRRQEAEQVLLGKTLPPDALIFSLSPMEPMEPLKPREVSKAFQRAAKAIGFPGLRLHDMRHNNASHLLAAGRPVPEVSKHLGHSSPEVTMRIYAHAIPKEEIGTGLLDEIVVGPAPVLPLTAAS
jgi:integrase